MLSVKLDPSLERVLEQDVDDLARYNILRYLHDHPTAQGDVRYFADELGLRCLERVGEALDALACRGFLERVACRGDSGDLFRLSADPANRELVDRLYCLSASAEYGEIVERLAARSLHRARRAAGASRGSRRSAPRR